MSVDVNPVNDKSGNFVVFHNPAVHPLPAGAGQTVAQLKDTSGKVAVSSGKFRPARSFRILRESK